MVDSNFHEEMGNFRRIMIPLILRMYPNLLESVTIQPMSLGNTRIWIQRTNTLPKVNWKKEGF